MNRQFSLPDTGKEGEQLLLLRCDTRWIAALLLLALVASLTGLPFAVPPVLRAANEADACDDSLVLWAANERQDKTIEVAGRQNRVTGRVHANYELRVGGSQNELTGPLHYVSLFKTTDKENRYPPPQQVAPRLAPIAFDVAAFAPAG